MGHCHVHRPKRRSYRQHQHCNTLYNIATYCNTLQHTATHCNTLQHNATHCNTLQHTATHCNTLQHRCVGSSGEALISIAPIMISAPCCIWRVPKEIFVSSRLCSRMVLTRISRAGACLWGVCVHARTNHHLSLHTASLHTFQSFF